MITNTKIPAERVYRQGAIATVLTVGVPLAAAIVLPAPLVWPLALVAPFVGMTALEAILDREGAFTPDAA